MKRINTSSPCLLFFDWDNTVRIGKNGFVSEENIRAIRAVQALGHKIVLNTGRSYAIIPQKAFDLFSWDGIIAGFSFVKTGRKILYEKFLPKSSLLSAVSFFERTGIAQILEGRDQVYLMGQDRRFTSPLENPREYILENWKKMRINNISVQANIKDVPDHLFPYCSTIYHPGFSEYLCRGFDKAFGMKILCEHFGIPQENTIAFGDSVNDTEMLRFAGLGVAMKTSMDGLHDVADIITDTDLTGVCDTLIQLFPEILSVDPTLEEKQS